MPHNIIPAAKCWLVSRKLRAPNRQFIEILHAAIKCTCFRFRPGLKSVCTSTSIKWHFRNKTLNVRQNVFLWHIIILVAKWGHVLLSEFYVKLFCFQLNLFKIKYINVFKLCLLLVQWSFLFPALMSKRSALLFINIFDIAVSIKQK